MRRTTAIVDGLLGGAAGAGVMSVLRMAARRWGLIDVTPPQATRRWLTRKGGVEPAGPGADHVLDSLVHLAVGVVGGALYGAFIERGRRPGLAAGALFGLGVWAAAFAVVAPALGITRPLRRTTWPETAVNVGAHLLYGTSIALVAGELQRRAVVPAAQVRQLRGRVG
jgi:uncharacterized membrane protein YagU involved in acid resistance